MTVSVNGIAHIQLTVNDPDACIPFWEKLCHFMDMKTLLRNENSCLLYTSPSPRD